MESIKVFPKIKYVKPSLVILRKKIDETTPNDESMLSMNADDISWLEFSHLFWTTSIKDRIKHAWGRKRKRDLVVKSILKSAIEVKYFETLERKESVTRDELISYFQNWVVRMVDYVCTNIDEYDLLRAYFDIDLKKDHHYYDYDTESNKIN